MDLYLDQRRQEARHPRRPKLELRLYSQAGNVLFPRWEHFIPTVGINSGLMGKNKMDLLGDKRLPLTNKSILSQKNPHPSHNLQKYLCTKGIQDGRDVLDPSHIPPISLTCDPYKQKREGRDHGRNMGGIKILRFLYFKGFPKIYGRD